MLSAAWCLWLPLLWLHYSHSRAAAATAATQGLSQLHTGCQQGSRCVRILLQKSSSVAAGAVGQRPCMQVRISNAAIALCAANHDGLFRGFVSAQGAVAVGNCLVECHANMLAALQCTLVSPHWGHFVSVFKCCNAFKLFCGHSYLCMQIAC